MNPCLQSTLHTSPVLHLLLLRIRLVGNAIHVLLLVHIHHMTYIVVRRHLTVIPWNPAFVGGRSCV